MTSNRLASSAEIVSVRKAAERYDVVIVGGGLAGLTLAIQLKRRRPDTSVAVLEKRDGPAPEAAFKVGESTNTPGAHYFSEVIGLQDHLEREHFAKSGLRYFLTAGNNEDITRRLEHGPPARPEFHSYQLDRGRLENELAARARSAGVDLLMGTRVGDMTLDEGDHTVTFSQFGQEGSVRGQWLVDAAGRASLVKRKLGIGLPTNHNINAAWFRLSGGLDFEKWGASNEEWMGRMQEPGVRKASTNHLMGEGYWIWLIVLATGPISIGVCADERFHPFDRINELDRLMEWLEEHEAQLAAELKPRMGEIEDFLRVQNFSYSVERILSSDRWCLVGEAASFADPLYSPGSDFIALSNTVACDVICRELDGEDVSERVDYFNDFYKRSFAHAIAKYEDQYGLFGNHWVANVKLGWDNIVRQSPSLLAINLKLDDLEFLKSIHDTFAGIHRLDFRMQQLFRDWNTLERHYVEGVLGVGGRVRPMFEALSGLVEKPNDEELRQILRDRLRSMEGVAVQIFHKAGAALPVPPDPARPVNPFAVSLDPERWEADGLYDDANGLTLEAAAEIAPGVENLWLDRALAEA